MSRIWIDVEDLFAHTGSFRRPSGIQRVTIELCRAMAGAADIGFLRHTGWRGFTAIGWPAIEAAMAELADDRPIPAPQGLWRLQWDAVCALAGVPGSLLPPARGPQARFAAGDTLLVLGAGWDDPGHAARVIATCRRHRLRLGVLLHDLIPLVRPEWCDPQTVRRFTLWSDALLRAADLVLADSQATARDIAARRAALRLPALPAHVIRLGDGFAPMPETPPPLEGRFALFVSTLERRKNHALLVEVWRRLLLRLGPQAVPKLVFVGREGPLVGDLLAVLRASRWLDGHVVWRQQATDAELAGLYQGCDFTLFPSLYEGWGLPVAESLCFGKPCLAARATSVPEVGGDLVGYFDPLDVADAERVIGAAVAEPAVLVSWEARIRAAFRPTAWAATAAMLRAAIEEGSERPL
jgi:glycosyltransferase involved in cell wall biosynthesis